MSRNAFGFVLLFLTALGCGGLSYAAYTFQASHPVVVRDEDLCPGRVAGAWLVAIDRTDPIPPQDKDRILHDVLAVAYKIPAGGRLLLHAITGTAETAAAPAPLHNTPQGFRRCKPFDPERVNPLIENERQIRARYDHIFLSPLTAAIGELTQDAASTETPLLESLEVMLWSPLFSRELPARTLVVFSDFIQNTKALSQRAGALTSACKILASPVGARLKARAWRGLSIVLEYERNGRDALRQTPEHQRFWTDLFYLLGAAEVHIDAALAPPPETACNTPEQHSASKRK